MTSLNVDIANEPLPFRFGRNDRIELNGRIYLHHTRAATGHVLMRYDNPGIVEDFTHEDLYHLHATGQLSVTKDFYSAGSVLARIDTPEKIADELPPNRKRKFAFRYDFVSEFLGDEAIGKVSRSDESMYLWTATFVAKRASTKSSARFGSIIELEKAPHPSAARRWIRRWEACDGDPMSLIDGHGRSGNRDARLDPEVKMYLNTYADKYASNLKPTMAELYRDLKRDFARELPGKDLPSRNAFERAIKRLDWFHVLSAREGVEAAKRKLYAVRKHLLATRPFERIEIDEQKIPLMTMLKEHGKWDELPEKLKIDLTHKRFYVSKAIDCFSRAIVAVVVTKTPTTESALATLRMLLMDKTAMVRSLGCDADWQMFGTPEMIVTDNGSNLVSAGFRAACLSLGIHVMTAPAGLPQMRGRIERSHRRENLELVSLFSGYTHENVMAKGDYDPEANISTTEMDVVKSYAHYFAGVYNNSPHEGIGGDTPANVFHKGVQKFGIIPPPHHDVIRHVLSTPVEGRIRNRGLCVAGLYYQSEALQHARRTVGQKNVLARVDTLDMGWISVRGPEGWMSVPCSVEGFDGVSLGFWRATQSYLRDRNSSIAALSEDKVHEAMRAIASDADRLREMAGIASPVMSSEEFVKVDRDLRRGFDMVRPDVGTDFLDGAEYEDGLAEDDLKVVTDGYDDEHFTE